MQADLLTLLLKLVLLVFLLITSLVPGNSVGTGEKEGWVQSVLQSVRCQHVASKWHGQHVHMLLLRSQMET